MSAFRILVLGTVVVCTGGAALGEQSILVGRTSGSFRWLDAAGNAYGAGYRSSYSYADATVTVDYTADAKGLSGILTAKDLKPNFAYQFKLSGDSRAAGTANEELGKTGRWWHEQWNGNAWANGTNAPNDKGDGSYPNPNDQNWLDTRDVTAGDSPTGYQHKFTGYRLFDYFFTDASGSATLAFAMNSSYHVLWKTTQGRPYESNRDGPIKAFTFDPDPGQHAA